MLGLWRRGTTPRSRRGRSGAALGVQPALEAGHVLQLRQVALRLGQAVRPLIMGVCALLAIPAILMLFSTVGMMLMVSASGTAVVLE